MGFGSVFHEVNLVSTGTDEVLPDGLQQTHEAVGVRGAILDENRLLKASADRAVDRDAFAPGVLDRDHDPVVPGGPRPLLAHPHVELRLVHVHERFGTVHNRLQFPGVQQPLVARSLHARVEDVAHTLVGDAVVQVDRAQRVHVDLHVPLALQLVHSAQQCESTPALQGLGADDELEILRAEFRGELPARLVVVAGHAEAVTHEPFQAVLHGPVREPGLLRDLADAHLHLAEVLQGAVPQQCEEPVMQG